MDFLLGSYSAVAMGLCKSMPRKRKEKKKKQNKGKMLYGKGRCIGPFNFQENNLGVCSLGLQIEGGRFFKSTLRTLLWTSKNWKGTYNR